MADGFVPPQGVRSNAKRGLELRAKHNRGGTAVGVARARDLSNGKSIPISTIRRMVSYFARHEVDKKGEGWGVDSAGYIAWLLWGGDAGRGWANRISREFDKKEKATMTDFATSYARIIKAEKQADGTLKVYGKATDDSIDIDKQICDPSWLKRAMPDWFTSGGNIREQHSNIAAGVATDYEEKEDGHYITALVVDPTSVKKVETGVLKGFSIGIRGPRVIRDNKAAGGRIVDGQIVEVSIVDRPANPNAKLTIAKAVDGGDLVAVKQIDIPSPADLVKFDPNQARGKDGRWSGSGAGVAGIAGNVPTGQRRYQTGADLPKKYTDSRNFPGGMAVAGQEVGIRSNTIHFKDGEQIRVGQTRGTVVSTSTEGAKVRISEEGHPLQGETTWVLRSGMDIPDRAIGTPVVINASRATGYVNHRNTTGLVIGEIAGNSKYTGQVTVRITDPASPVNGQTMDLLDSAVAAESRFPSRGSNKSAESEENPMADETPEVAEEVTEATPEVAEEVTEENAPDPEETFHEEVPADQPALDDADALIETAKSFLADLKKFDQTAYDEARTSLGRLIQIEADEMVEMGHDELNSLTHLVESLRHLAYWFEGEEAEGEVAEETGEMETESIELAAEADEDGEMCEKCSESMKMCKCNKSADAESEEDDAEAPVEKAIKITFNDSEISAIVEKAVSSAKETIEAEITILKSSLTEAEQKAMALELELETVKKSAVVGGPKRAVLTSPDKAIDEMLQKAASYRTFAKTTDDPLLKKGYKELAEDLEAKVAIRKENR